MTTIDQFLYSNLLQDLDELSLTLGKPPMVKNNVTLELGEYNHPPIEDQHLIAYSPTKIMMDLFLNYKNEHGECILEGEYSTEFGDGRENTKVTTYDVVATVLNSDTKSLTFKLKKIATRLKAGEVVGSYYRRKPTPKMELLIGVDVDDPTSKLRIEDTSIYLWVGAFTILVGKCDPTTKEIVLFRNAEKAITNKQWVIDALVKAGWDGSTWQVSLDD